MKKVFLAVVFAVIAAVCAQAQFYAGGSLGIDFNASSRTMDLATNKQPSSFSFNMNPIVGYHLSDGFSAGLRFAIGIRIDNDRADTPTKIYTYSWGLTPLVRNTLLNADKFSLLLESSLFVSGSKIKLSTGSTVTDGPKLIGFGVWALPVLQYKLTDKLSLEARSHIVSIGFLTATTKDNPKADAPKTSKSTFGFGVNSGSQNITTPFEIGMVVNF